MLTFGANKKLKKLRWQIYCRVATKILRLADPPLKFHKTLEGVFTVGDF